MTKNKEKNLKEELNDGSVNAETAQETVQEAQPESVDNAPDKDQLSEEEKLRLQVEELEASLQRKRMITSVLWQSLTISAAEPRRRSWTWFLLLQWTLSKVFFLCWMTVKELLPCLANQLTARRQRRVPT